MNRSRIARVAAGAFAIVLAFAAPSSRATPPTDVTTPQPGEVMLPVPPTCFGDYRLAGDPNERIVIEPIGEPPHVRIRTTAGWGAVGYLVGDDFQGVLRSADLQGGPLPGPIGRITFLVRPDRSVRAMIHSGSGGGTRVEDWELFASATPPPFGTFDELPEVIERPAPIYPEHAREARVEGTVMVEALVGTDGKVTEAKISRSIPMLDAAALAAVKRWRFKPALMNGKPVESRLVVPVKFSLR